MAQAWKSAQFLCPGDTRKAPTESIIAISVLTKEFLAEQIDIQCR